MRHRSFIVAGCIAVIAATVSPIRANANATLVHQFNLDNSYADSVGSSTLVADGGSLNAGGGYSFGQNQGLTLSNAFTGFEGDYTIQLDVKYSDLNSRTAWRKILDFKDKSSDSGFYYQNGFENFFPVAQGPDQVTTNHLDRVVLTRDGGSGVVSAYLNGVQQFSFTDSSNLAVFDSPANVVHFAEDDANTGFNEDDAGGIRDIRIFEGAASLAQIQNLAPVPEATTTVSFVLMMLMGVVFFVRRSRKSTETR